MYTEQQVLIDIRADINSTNLTDLRNSRPVLHAIINLRSPNRSPPHPTRMMIDPSLNVIDLCTPPIRVRRQPLRTLINLCSPDVQKRANDTGPSSHCPLNEGKGRDMDEAMKEVNPMNREGMEEANLMDREDMEEGEISYDNSEECKSSDKDNSEKRKREEDSSDVEICQEGWAEGYTVPKRQRMCSIREMSSVEADDAHDNDQTNDIVDSRKERYWQMMWMMDGECVLRVEFDTASASEEVVVYIDEALDSMASVDTGGAGDVLLFLDDLGLLQNQEEDMFDIVEGCTAFVDGCYAKWVKNFALVPNNTQKGDWKMTKEADVGDNIGRTLTFNLDPEVYDELSSEVSEGSDSPPEPPF